MQITPSHSKNLGNALENWVFMILNRKEHELYYLKESKEIDFYSGGILYQVAYSIDAPKTRKRELEAFSVFSTVSTQCRLITFDSDEVLEGIEVQSVDKFIFSLYAS